MRPWNDLTGRTFGLLTAIKPTDKRHAGSVVWRFRCRCGRIVERSGGAVSNPGYQGRQSCGCRGLDLKADAVSPTRERPAATALAPLQPTQHQPPKTIRDEFAMAALTGRMANPQASLSAEVFAAQAYQVADAMMSARELQTADTAASTTQARPANTGAA